MNDRLVKLLIDAMGISVNVIKVIDAIGKRDAVMVFFYSCIIIFMNLRLIYLISGDANDG